MNDSESHDELLKAIDESMRMISDISEMEYDGVAGSLPEEVPKHVKDEFINRRTNMLSEYTLDEMRKFLSAYHKGKLKGDGSLRTGPRMVGCYPISIEDDLDFMCYLRHWIQKGSDEYLIQFSGSAALVGRKVQGGGIIGHIKAYGTNEEKESKITECLKIFEEVKMKYPELSTAKARKKAAVICKISERTLRRFEKKREK